MNPRKRSSLDLAGRTLKLHLPAPSNTESFDENSRSITKNFFEFDRAPCQAHAHRRSLFVLTHGAVVVEHPEYLQHLAKILGFIGTVTVPDASI